MVNKKIVTSLGIIFFLLLFVAVILNFRGNVTNKTYLNLYYVNPAEFKLEKRSISINGKGTVKIALTSLFKGVKDSSVENLFPEGVKVNSVSEDKKNDILNIDLSANVLSVNYGLKVNYLYLMSIVNTAADISGYVEFKLTFDGKKIEFFNNGLYIGNTLKRDNSVVK